MASCTYNCFMNVINIGNSIIGVSILAMPYCFRKCGILLSLVLILVSGILTKLACYLILKSAVMARRRSFEFLAFHTFGSYGKLAVEMSVIGFLIGVCIAFFVVIGDLGPPLAAEFLNIENAPNLRTNVLMLVGLCVALPLGLLRKIDSLTSLSALSIAFYVCLILKIFAEAVPNLSENEWWYEVNWWRSEGILPCLPIFSMALSCQTQLFEFFDTTNEPSLKRMQSVIDGAVYLCSAVYLMVGIFGYIAFHDKNITGNILVLLTPSVVTEFIKLGFILTVAVSFPLCLFPCRSSLHSLLFKQGFVHHEINVNTIPDHRFRILTISLVIVTIGIAIMLPNIEFVLGIIGSTIGTLICLILPAVIFIYDSNKMTSERRKAQILFGVGVFILIACTFSTLHENNNREKNIPIEMAKPQKLTPAPLLILSSTAPVIIQSPKIALKDQPAIQNEKKIEIPQAKIDVLEQKRLEPPVPQEPEMKVPQEPEVKVPQNPEIKIEQNADLDPQALQKEDKELQKEINHPSANSISSSKTDEGLEKQEKVLKKLEEQHEEQKLILEQQKQILEELKHHKESHEEMKRNEVIEKQQINKKIEQMPAVPKQDKIEVQPVAIKNEVVKDVPIVENKIDKNIEQEILLNKVSEVKPPISYKNISLDNIPRQKKSENLGDIGVKSKMEGLTMDENLAKKKQYMNSKHINESVAVNHDMPVLNKNFTANTVSIVPKNSPNILSIPPPAKIDTIKVATPESIKNTEMHIKRRETLEKKNDIEENVPLPNQIANVNLIAYSKEKNGT